MTIQEKLNRKGYQLAVVYQSGERTAYYAIERIYGKKTRFYKTQTELYNAIK